MVCNHKQFFGRQDSYFIKMLKSNSAQKEEKEFWIKWLKRYRSMKCLWEEDAKREAGRDGRIAAYQELAQLIIDKGIAKDADASFVRSRISTFRTGYRREMHKVQVAKENGCNYEPTLFYYKILDFLNDSPENFDAKDQSENEEDNDPISSSPQNVPRTRSTTKKIIFGDKSTGITKKVEHCLSSDVELIDNTSPNDDASYMPPNKISKKEKFSHTEIHAADSLDCNDFESNHSVRSIAIAPFEKEIDEYDIFGKRMAAHFRNMSPNQRLIAEKIITDVCIYGRMERLTLDSEFYVNAIESNEERIVHQRQQKVDYDDPNTFIYTS